MTPVDDLVAQLTQIPRTFMRWVRVAGPASVAIVGVVCVVAFWWEKV